MPAVVNVNATGRREFLMNRLYKVDNRMTTFTSMARKPKGGNSETTGIPNSIIGSYQAKVLGDIKAGGRADGKDVTAFDSNPPREQISFRPEFFYRAPMVGTLAKDDVIAGLEDSGGEWADAVGDQMILHKRDMEKQFLSAVDSSANGGREGGTVTRGLEKWISASASDFSELAPPSGARTPSAQIYTGSIGTVDSGLTEDAVKGILKARWDATGDSGELVGFLGTYIKERFSLFKEYKPTLSNLTVIVRTQTEAYTNKDIANASVSEFNTEWGSFSLFPVNTIFLTDAYTGLFVDMAQIEIRSRFWMREKPLPDLGGGPREEISSFVALIPGDLRSHAKIDATA